MERFTHRPEKEPVQDVIPDQERIANIQDMLEACAKNNEEIHILEEALTSSPKALSALYDRVAKKYKIFIGALLFAVVSHTAEARPLKEDLKTQITQLEQSINTMGNEIIEKNTGINFVKEAEKIGRNATFYISEIKSPYIITHLGQSHRTTHEVNYKYLDEIVKSQTGIAKFLRDTINQSSAVFIEGYATKSNLFSEAERDVVVQLKNSRDFSELKKIYIEACIKSPYTLTVAIFNKISGKKLESFGFSEISPLVYSNGQQTLTLNDADLFSDEITSTVPNDIQSTLIGAAEILDAERYINAQAAETNEAFEKTVLLRKRLEEKGITLGKLFVSFEHQNKMYQEINNEILPNITEDSADFITKIAQEEPCKASQECQKIVAEILYEDIPSIRKAVIDDREDVAIELIAEYAKTSDQTYFPLVYGNLHDFTRAVKRWNEKNPELQFNLVTVK